MANKYLERDATTGRVEEVEATVISAGAGDAGEIPGLDATGRLDPSVMPVGVVADSYTGVASGALTAGDFVAVTLAGITRSSAASGGNDVDGFVLASSLAAAAATIYFEGRNTGLSGLTVGARYYLSDSTPGGVTLTPVSGTGKRHQYLGKAVTASTIAFEATDPITLA